MSTTLQTFWGGSTVRDGKVRQLDVTSFAELVDQYFDKPVCLQYSRQEWTALTEDQRKKAKDVSYVCSCSFKPGTTLRNDASADLLQMVCFDIDDPEIARDFANAPQALEDALWPYSFVAHHTASSTPESPRVRITVPVEPCDPSNHKLAAYYLCRRLGMPAAWKGRRESFVLSQPFYRPVKLQGEDFNAIIASRTNGDVVELADLPPEIEEDVERRYSYQADYDEDSDLANLPIPGLTVDDIREALFTIDPDCGYQTWCEVACALRHNFYDEETAEEAFHIFVEWSEGGTKFRGVEDCYSKWKSFSPSAHGRRPITVKSLFHHAMGAGWAPAKIAAKIEQDVAARINACDDVTVLSQEGPKWIEAAEYKNDISEERMVTLLQSRLTALGGIKFDKAIIRKAISRERRATKAEKVSDNKPAWLRPWCYIASFDRFYNTATGMLLTTEAFNRMFGSEMMKQNEEALATGRPLVQPADFALNTEGMMTKVDSMVYDPRFGGENHFFRMPGEDLLYVNEYRESSVPRVDEHAKANSAKAGKALRRLLKELMAEEEHILHLLDWMAHLVQFPGVQIRHAPCIQGGHGAGKTTISRYLTAALGKANTKQVDTKVISTNFNDWSTGAVLVTIEEIWAQNQSKAETMNALKPLLTNEEVALHRKGRDVVKVSNITNYIAYTNKHNALYLEEGDRRWWVVKSKVQTKRQVLRLNAKVVAGMPFFEYQDMVIKKHAGAIRHFLLTYEIRSSFDPNGPAPDTPWRHQMVESSKNALQREIEAVVADNVPLVGQDIIYLPALLLKLRDTPSAVAAMQRNHPAEHYLYEMNFQPIENGKRFPVNGSYKGEIWVNREHYIEAFGHPHEILLERHANIPDETI